MARNPLSRVETSIILKEARRAAQQSRRRFPTSMTAPERHDPAAVAYHKGWWRGSASALVNLTHSELAPGRHGRARRHRGMAYRFGPYQKNPGARMAKRAQRGGGRDYSDLLLWGGLAFVLYKAGALTSLGVANAGGVPTMTQAQLSTLNSLGTAVLALGVLTSGDVALNNGWFIRPDGTLVA